MCLQSPPTPSTYMPPPLWWPAQVLLPPGEQCVAAAVPGACGGSAGERGQDLGGTGAELSWAGEGEAWPSLCLEGCLQTCPSPGLAAPGRQSVTQSLLRTGMGLRCLAAASAPPQASPGAPDSTSSPLSPLQPPFHQGRFYPANAPAPSELPFWVFSSKFANFHKNAF